MSIQIDNAELMSLLESSDIHTSSQVRELIQEQLNTGRNRHTKSIAMCYRRRSIVRYCRPSTLEQSTCRCSVCFITHNISPKLIYFGNPTQTLLLLLLLFIYYTIR